MVYFYCANIFEVFSKIFFRQVPECVSRSLAAWQGKILGHTEITTGFLSLCHRQSLSLSKAGAKLRTFFFHAILYDTFFQKNYGLTLNLLLISEKYTETFYWYITAEILCCRTYTLLLISMDNRLYRKLCTGL